MNIGFFYRQTFPPGTGSSVHGYQLAKGLAERGHKLLRWYYGSDSNPVITHYRGRQLVAFLRRVDVLYVRVDWRARSKLAWRRLALRRLPVVWELNGVPEEMLDFGYDHEGLDRITNRLRQLARNVDAAIGVTPDICDYLRATLGISQVYCIPNGSDPQLFTPDNSQSPGVTPLNVVWIGRVSCPWHNISGILAAARLVGDKNANVQFTLYGHPDRLREDFPKNVAWGGIVPYTELGKHLAQADVGIHMIKPVSGSPIDGSSMKVFDYMACGLAVLATGGTARVVRDTEAGLVVTGTAEDLAEKILRLEANRDLCRRLGLNGRRAVEDYYNWGRVVTQTERVLQDVLEKR